MKKCTPPLSKPKIETTCWNVTKFDMRQNSVQCMIHAKFQLEISILTHQNHYFPKIPLHPKFLWYRLQFYFKVPHEIVNFKFWNSLPKNGKLFTRNTSYNLVICLPFIVNHSHLMVNLVWMVTRIEGEIFSSRFLIDFDIKSFHVVSLNSKKIKLSFFY